MSTPFHPGEGGTAHDDVMIECIHEGCSWGYASPDRDAVHDAMMSHLRERHSQPADLMIRPTLGPPRLYWVSGASIVGLVDPFSPYQRGVRDELDRLTPFDRRLIETTLEYALDDIRRRVARDRGAMDEGD